MAEEKDIERCVYPVKKPDTSKDIYSEVPSHAESERDEEREGGPEAPMEDRRGPIILSPSTYVEEDEAFEEEKRRPLKDKKKK